MEPGKNYFVWQEVKMGMWMARSQLQKMFDDKLISEQEYQLKRKELLEKF